MLLRGGHDPRSLLHGRGVLHSARVFEPGNPLYIGLAVIAALVILRLHLWRALIFLKPSSVRVEADAPADNVTVPGALEPAWDHLRAEGFTLLGTHLEEARFAPAVTMYDAVHAEKRVFASLSIAKEGGAQLVLLTPTAAGGFVLTANYRRPAREVPGRYSSGGIEGAAPERLVKAHLRRTEGLATPNDGWTLDGRVAAARAWYLGAGKTELRQQHAVGLLWTLFAIGMVGAAIFGRGS